MHTTLPTEQTVICAPWTIQPWEGAQPRIWENKETRSILPDTMRRYHWANFAILSILSDVIIPAASMMEPSS
jgi:hypothetical protein